VLSRRQFFAGASVLPAYVLASAVPAEAAQPFIVADDTVREVGGVVFISDSTSNGSRSDLLQQLAAQTTLGPYRFDIGPGRAMSRPGRTMYSGVEAVRRSREAGFTPTSFVVALGANDLKYGIRTPITARQTFDRLMEEIGPDCTVGLVNLYSTRPSFAWRYNKYLAQAVGRWPNAYLVDWAAVARRNRRWHRPDGFHMNLMGSKKKNTWIIQTMIAACVKHAQRTTGGDPA